MVSFSDIVELWFSKRDTTPRCTSCRNFVGFVYNYQAASIKILEKS